MSQPVAVGVGACQCPGAPHPDGDVVSLRPVLGLASGIAIQRLIVEANQDRADAAEIAGRLAEAYLLHGVAEWNLVDERGAIAVTPEAIRRELLDDFSRGAPVAEAADELYMATVLGPLVNRALQSSPTTSTNGSTSVTLAGRSKPRRRSKPSSTTTIPMDATAETSA
jgi:hypothetical protein